MLPATTSRVENATSEAINRRLAAEIEESVRFHPSTRRKYLHRRLHELDHEWDIERALEANAATLALDRHAAWRLCGPTLLCCQ